MLHQIGRHTRRSAPGLYRCTRIKAQRASPSLVTRHSLKSARGKVLQYPERRSKKPEKGHSSLMLPGLALHPPNTKASHSFATEKNHRARLAVRISRTRYIRTRLPYLERQGREAPKSHPGVLLTTDVCGIRCFHAGIDYLQ